jgi:2-dehydro-3-deoxyphosphogluconate aldolase/(4S)-4-hydroxy-2-oxoglutarate aldolase
MMQAYEAGADFIKLFPARQMGPQYVRDVLAPLPHLRLVPTGGVNAQNAAAYLQAGAIAVGIGGNLVSEQTVAAGDWDQITRLARECSDATRL